MTDVRLPIWILKCLVDKYSTKFIPPHFNSDSEFEPGQFQKTRAERASQIQGNWNIHVAFRLYFLEWPFPRKS